MKRSGRQFLFLAANAAALPTAARIATAQSYPTRPITIVVGAAAGGPTDTIGRIITERMRVSLGQTIFIENNGAAAGSIAHGRVARAAPDGYTLKPRPEALGAPCRRLRSKSGGRLSKEAGIKLEG